MIEQIVDGKILTTLGMLPLTELTRKSGSDEDDRAKIEWVEYYHPSQTEHVHRSAHVALKQGLGIEGALATLA